MVYLTKILSTTRIKRSGFRPRFPKTWKKVPTSHSETRLKVVSDAGRGVDDFTIVAMYFDDLNTRPPMILWLGL